MLEKLLVQEYLEKIPDLPIGKPGAISTETFIRIGSFDSEYEVKAIKRYYHSKFLEHYLV